MSKVSKIFVRQGNLEGSVEHYFHFLFGYLIPFLNNVSNDDGNLYLFRDCGPVINPLLRDIPGYRTGFLVSEKPEKIVCFRGHDCPEFPDMDMDSSRQRVMEVFGVLNPPQNGRVLIVDRAKPHEFYNSKAEILDSGSSKRSVPNMKDVFNKIAQRFPADLVCLEGMTLPEQIALFASRKIVVLQHGAAMSNLLFSRKGSFVVEIRSFGTQDYFSMLKSRCGLRCSHVVQDHDHADVDPDAVLNSLRSLMACSLKIL